MSVAANILIVDDQQTNRDVLENYVLSLGHVPHLAENGLLALTQVRRQLPDLVLLDIMMPEMDGHEVLERLKADSALRAIPVVVISALDDMDSIARCIRAGADDYLTKPFDPVLLEARIGASLERKRWHDQEKAYRRQIEDYSVRLEKAHRETESLLLDILPEAIVGRLKSEGGTIADRFEAASVLFADIVGFTPLSERMAPEETVELLRETFARFDKLADKHGLEKIKTVGDAYMAASGLPEPRDDHAQAAAEMALDIREVMAEPNSRIGKPLPIRIGIASGRVVAGVMGKRRFIYDLWGDTVNTAARMESHGVPGEIQVTTEAYELLRGKYALEERGTIDIKGKGPMRVYLLKGRG